MPLIIFISVTLYLITGAAIGGIIDDSRNEAITDGLLNDDKAGVFLCVFLWPVLAAFTLIITILNTAYLIGKKIKIKWWNK